MAKIVIAGKAVIITSALKLEDIRTVKKYRPDALILKGGEDGKEPIFGLSVGTTGEINNFGVCFTDETRDDAKLATLTLTTSYSGEDIEEHIADEIGGAVNKLNKLEAALPAVLEEIAAEKAEIMSNITVAV